MVDWQTASHDACARGDQRPAHAVPDKREISAPRILQSRSHSTPALKWFADFLHAAIALDCKQKAVSMKVVFYFTPSELPILLCLSVREGECQTYEPDLAHSLPPTASG